MHLRLRSCCLLLSVLAAGTARATPELDMHDWTRRDFTGGPAPRYGHLMSPAGPGKLVMLAGTLASGSDLQTWQWDSASGAWTSLAAVAPPPAQGGGAALTWDARGQRVLLFGGTVYKGTVVDHLSNEVWELDLGAQQWRKITPAAGPVPEARVNAGWVHDVKGGSTLLHGGTNKLATFYDTWEWSGSAWTKIDTLRQPSGGMMGMLYLPNQERVVVFYNTGAVAAWTLEGLYWTILTQQFVQGMSGGASLAYAGSGRVLAFGGVVVIGANQRAVNQTWEWTPGDWLVVSTAQLPSIREGMALVYDESRDRAVMYGGRAFPAGDSTIPPDLRGDLWEYAVTAATEGSICDPKHADRCTSGHCVDGYCCNVAACGMCEACNLGGLMGQCAYRPACQLTPTDGGAPPRDAAVVPPPPDAAAPADRPSGPAPDAGAPALEAGAPAGGSGGAATGGGGASNTGGAGGAGGAPEEGQSDGGGKAATAGARLYRGPACALSPGPGRAGGLGILVALLVLFRRRRA